nr:hypothetical protein [Tanacetum cinerariifolium]
MVTQKSSVKIFAPVKENNGAPLIEDWESDEEDEVESPLEKERKTVEPSADKVEVEIPKQNDKPARRPVKYYEMYITQRPRGNISYLTDFKEFDGGYVAFGEELKVVRLLENEQSKLLADESHVLLKVPRKNNMYSVDIKNIVPKKDLTCLVAKATNDKSMLWHRRLGHINFKNINKLVKDNLVRGLPSKPFENDQTCVACLKGKQHKVSFKSKIQNSISQPLFMLHMDLFGPTFVSSIMHKKYYLVITDDFSSLLSVARTPQQNRVAERRNKTLIKAARTMLANSKLPITFWAEAFNTACYVQNKVPVVKPHFKTLYELFRGDGPKWLFDIETLAESMNYVPVITEESKRITNALKYSAWVEAMQEELLQFHLQQGCTQEEGIDYDEVFTAVARIEAIRLFLACASFMGFLVYQMDVKSDFLYGRIKEEVYVCQPPGFEDLDYPDKVYKVEKALCGLHQAPRAWSMIKSLMYLTSSRPDIMFAICKCAKF